MSLARRPEEKIVNDWPLIAQTCQQVRASGKKVVLATGAFDLIHYGHTAFLFEIAKLGDYLVIGINGDESIRSTKGHDRPILNERIRSYVVAGMECVDMVCIFNSGDELVDRVRPSVLVMSPSSHFGIERRAQQIKTVHEHGGEIVMYEVPGELHTSDIIKKIKAL